MKKIMEIPGGRGSNAKPSGTENPVGWGVKLEKNPPWGGMDIFWNHTLCFDPKDLNKALMRSHYPLPTMNGGHVKKKNNNNHNNNNNKTEH